MTKQRIKQWLKQQITFNEAQAKKFEELGDKEKAAYWKGKASAEKEILRCCF